MYETKHELTESGQRTLGDREVHGSNQALQNDYGRENHLCENLLS